MASLLKVLPRTIPDSPSLRIHSLAPAIEVGVFVSRQSHRSITTPIDGSKVPKEFSILRTW